MAFVSQSSGLTISADTETVVYDGTANNSGNGAPANGAVVIGVFASNIGTETSNVQFYVRKNSETNRFIIKDAPIPVGSTLDSLPGKIVLNAGDKIYMKSSVADTLQGIVSLLEN